MNKQQLASKIWESANKMRSKIEANEYKDYILGFIFYKFLSETEVARLKARDFAEEDLPSLVEDDAETVEFVKGECGYFIAYENLFSTWIAKGGDFDISNVRDALSAFSHNIDSARKRVFDGIFDTLQTGLSKLGTDARSQSKAARDLVGVQHVRPRRLRHLLVHGSSNQWRTDTYDLQIRSKRTYLYWQ